MDETENMLYQMMVFTGEAFRAEQLQVSPKAPEYFNSTCKYSALCDILVHTCFSISSGKLKKDPTIFHCPIETRLNHLKVASGEEVTATARLMERCLHLDPARRSTAAELLSDSWFNGVE